MESCHIQPEPKPCHIQIERPLPVTGVTNLDGHCSADGADSKTQTCKQDSGESFKLAASGCQSINQQLVADGHPVKADSVLTCKNGHYVGSGGISDYDVEFIGCNGPSNGQCQIDIFMPVPSTGVTNLNAMQCDAQTANGADFQRCTLMDGESFELANSETSCNTSTNGRQLLADGVAVEGKNILRCADGIITSDGIDDNDIEQIMCDSNKSCCIL